MHILSIDPGMHYCGFVLIDTEEPNSPKWCQSIKIADPKTDVITRCADIQSVLDIHWKHVVQADAILIESQFRGKMREVQVILVALLNKYLKPKHIVHPIHVKKYFKYQTSGYRANKIESVEAAKLLAPCEFANANKEKALRIHDMADAYMQAIFWGVYNGYISKEFTQVLFDRHAASDPRVGKPKRQSPMCHTDQKEHHDESSQQHVSGGESQQEV